ETGRETHAAAEHATDARRRLVLLHDLDLAVLAALDHRRVVRVDEVRLGVQRVDRVVVGLRRVDVGVGTAEHEEGVDRHGWLLWGTEIWQRPRPRQDSNLRTRLRRPMLYPLSYEGRFDPSGRRRGRA